jgi:hypothetical protein
LHDASSPVLLCIFFEPTGIAGGIVMLCDGGILKPLAEIRAQLRRIHAILVHRIAIAHRHRSVGQ